jgi:hypothetical protein
VTWDAWYALSKNTATIQSIRQYMNTEMPTAELLHIIELVALAVPQAVDNSQNLIDLYHI